MCSVLSSADRFRKEWDKPSRIRPRSAVEDVGGLPETDEGKRNLVELMEFIHTFLSSSEGILEQVYPTLINQDIDIAQAVGMYKRFAVEATGVLNGYAGPAALMKTKPPKKGEYDRSKCHCAIFVTLYQTPLVMCLR